MGSVVVFATERGLRHQQAALAAAPGGLEVVMLREPGREELRGELARARYLISERRGVVDRDLIRAAPQLQLIQRLGSLCYDIDLDAAREAGVAVCIWPIRSVIHVAEHIVMQLLVLARKALDARAIALAADPRWGESRRTDEDTFAYNWSGRDGVEALYGRTIGILGLGEIGAELARRLRGWGCRVHYSKRHRLPSHVEEELAIAYAAPEALLAQVDYLVNLLPYAPATDGWLDGDRLAMMPRGASLVSCGSGSVIDEAALAEAIRSGHLRGAALDTFEWEPLRADNPLLPLARAGYNVLLTPHIAAGASSAERVGRREDYANILACEAGKPLRHRLV
jgi:phosphoglycerate dehydrogenase-like enzyme